MAALVEGDDEGFTTEITNASPAHLLMKIESFSLLSKHGIDKYESREFEASDYKWRLVIHPNGVIKSGNNEDDHISVYLSIVDTDSLPVGWEDTAAFSVFLYNHVLDNYICFQGKMRRFHASKSQWGFAKLVLKGSLRAPGNGFLVDDICVFGAEVAVVKTQRVARCVSVRELDIPYKRDWKISNFSKLKQDWESKEFTVGDYQWYIRLHPNGYSSKKERSVFMYLYLVGAESFDSHERVKADFHLRIKNQLNDQHKSRHASKWFSSSICGSGWSAFMLLSDIFDSKKGFLVKDRCIVEVEISVEAVIRDASSTDTMSRGVRKNENLKTDPTCLGWILGF